MNYNKKLSNVTKIYMGCFLKILETMIDSMTNVTLNQSISHNFIVQMIPHHQAAIEMSRNILKYTTFIPLQNIALNIVSEQTKSIENMMTIINTCDNFENKIQKLYLCQKTFTSDN